MFFYLSINAIFYFPYNSINVLVSERLVYAWFKGYLNFNFVTWPTIDKEKCKVMLLRLCLVCLSFHEIKIEISFKLNTFQRKYLATFAWRIENHIYRTSKYVALYFRNKTDDLEIFQKKRTWGNILFIDSRVLQSSVALSWEVFTRNITQGR